jgi:ankyrin repeat protein
LKWRTKTNLLIQKRKEFTEKMLLNRETPLHLVSWSYHIGVNEIAKVLLEYGAEINATNANGKTALQLAIDNNNEEITEFLRKRGAKE